MPSFTRLAIAAIPLVASVSAWTPVFNKAWGNAIIKNSCDQNVYFWEDKGNYGPQMQTISPHQQFEEPLFQTGKENGAGPSFKLATTNDGGSVPTSITQFEYTVDAPDAHGTDPNQVWFDISNVDAHNNPPFAAGGIQVYSPQDKRAAKVCPAGQMLCKAGYNNPNDDQQAMTNTYMGNDIVMELCKAGDTSGSGGSGSSGNSGSGSGSSAQAPASSPSSTPAAASSPPAQQNPPIQDKHVVNNPAPSPSPSPAPTPVQEPQQQVDSQGNTKVVMVTETAAPAIVTVVVSARDASPPAIKREEHIHNHAHAHNKINKRRHGA